MGGTLIMGWVVPAIVGSMWLQGPGKGLLIVMLPSWGGQGEGALPIIKEPSPTQAQWEEPGVSLAEKGPSPSLLCPSGNDCFLLRGSPRGLGTEGRSRRTLGSRLARGSMSATPGLETS